VVRGLVRTDAVYLDTFHAAWKWTASSLESMRAQWARGKSHEGYQTLLDTCPATGVWDDHVRGEACACGGAAT
jgi:phosphodiesterase/alkaline phosphatase D-like protein